MTSGSGVSTTVLYPDRFRQPPAFRRPPFLGGRAHRGYLEGGKTAGRWNLFHARDNATIEMLETEPGRFAGLDHASGQLFAVKVNGRISLVKDMVPGRSRRYAL